MEKVHTWRRLDGTKLSLPITEEVRMVLLSEAAQGNELKVCIGTDSQVKARFTSFATVVVFLRKGKGGFMYLQKEQLERRMSIHERMLLEVSKSVQVAYQLQPILTAFNVAMEVHADINTQPAFKSNNALREAMGYITGMGFSFRAKPDAFASSVCADRAVH